MGSRSGRPSALDGVRSMAIDAIDAIDATDAAGIAATASGCDVIVNALNPASYTNWARDWPPMASAVLVAVERTGAGLITISKPVRVWPARRTPHRGPAAQRDRQGSGPGADVEGCLGRAPGRTRPGHGGATVRLLRCGRLRRCLLRQHLRAEARGVREAGQADVGSPDASHSRAYLPDIGALVAALALDDRAWGRPWHVPTGAPRSIRQLVQEVDALAGRGPTKVGLLPGPVRQALRVVPLIRSLDETVYQFDSDFVVDSTDAEATFALSPTPMREAVKATLAGRAS